VTEDEVRQKANRDGYSWHQVTCQIDECKEPGLWIVIPSPAVSFDDFNAWLKASIDEPRITLCDLHFKGLFLKDAIADGELLLKQLQRQHDRRTTTEGCQDEPF
jgi:hypothetical protein